MQDKLIILSGGALGSDTLFGNIANTYCVHFSFDGHSCAKPLNGEIVKIPNDKLFSRESELDEVFNYMKRSYDLSNDFVHKLLLRNMYQITNNKYKSQLCISIADVYSTCVSGGTNYAVIKAIIEGLPVVVLNKEDNLWYTYSYTENMLQLLEYKIDLNEYKVITGVGSRSIDASHILTVLECFKNKCISNKQIGSEVHMNIYSKGAYPSNVLSNFSPNPFIVDGVECMSMEGFLQSLKFKNPDMQIEICKLFGGGAKKKGASKKWYKTQTLYWKGVEYKRDSQEYQELLDRAFLGLGNNLKFKKALQSTGKATLTHTMGKKKKSETILTEQEFCSRLMWLRDCVYKIEG